MRVLFVTILGALAGAAGCSRDEPDSLASLTRAVTRQVSTVAAALEGVDSSGDAERAIETIAAAAAAVEGLAARADALGVPDKNENEARRAETERGNRAVERLGGREKHLRESHPELWERLREPLLAFHLRLGEFSFGADPVFKAMEVQASRRAAPALPTIPPPPPPFDDRVEQMRSKHGAGKVVVVELAGPPAGANLTATWAELKRLAGATEYTARSDGARHRIALAPVESAQGLAAAITFGTVVVDHSKSEIRVDADPARLPKSR